MDYLKSVDKYEELVKKAERDLWKMPEVGYKEFKTNQYMIEAFERLGYKLEKPENITGFYTVVDTGKAGPTVLVLAELDALYCAAHPESDKETGAVHACGHHAQLAAMLGLAACLKEETSLEGLCGKIKLCVVPAEEGIEINWRTSLIKDKVITFATGKAEFLQRGYFDDVDIAMMVHISSEYTEPIVYAIKQGCNGNIKKKVEIKGKAAHAGEAPFLGVNALNAATLALSAVNALRETFQEKDYVRFHGIITNGGGSVNTVPDKVVIESYVRAANEKALKQANERVNLAIAGAVSANGCVAKITDNPGSFPLKNDENFSALVVDVFRELVGNNYMDERTTWKSSSTDMGDLSCVFPVVHPYVMGAVGALHGNNFYIKDAKVACLESARFQYALIRELLSNHAEKATFIIQNYKRECTIQEFLESKKSIYMDKEVVKMEKDGTVVLDYKNN